MTMHPSNEKEIKALIATLREAGTGLDGAHTAAMMKIEAAWSAFAEAVLLAIGEADEAREAYNTALEGARAAVEDGVAELQERIETRSEKWLESAAGTEATAQIEGLEAFTTEYQEVEPFTLTSLPDLEAQGVPDLEGEVMLLPEIVTNETELPGGAL